MTMFARIFIASALVGIIAILFKYNRCNNCLKRYPGPKPLPILGNALQLGNRMTMLRKLFEFQQVYGGIYSLKLGPVQPTLVLTDCKIVEYLLKSKILIEKSDMYDLAKNWVGTGLASSKGEQWKQHRKILTPAFNVQILESFIQIFDSAVDILIKKLRKEVNKNSVDISNQVSLCALDIVCESIMSTSMNAQQNPRSVYVKGVHEMCRIIIERAFSPFKMFDLIYRFTEDYKIEQKVVKELHDYCNSVIHKRREVLMKQLEVNMETQNRSAFLDTLLQATVDKKPLSDKDIRDEVNTFMLGGHETTSTAFNFALYSLSKHRTVQNKVVEELKAIFGDDVHRPATLQELNEMKYVEMVIKETLRLYPSGPFVARKLEQDVVYDGEILPKGLTLIVFIFGIHRNPDYYPDPEKFDPERFTQERCIARNPYTYLPFSAGPRNCIGQKFAMLELKSMLSKFLRHFEILPAIPEHNVSLITEVGLTAANGVFIQLKKRILSI